MVLGGGKEEWVGRGRVGGEGVEDVLRGNEGAVVGPL